MFALIVQLIFALEVLDLRVADLLQFRGIDGVVGPDVVGEPIVDILEAVGTLLRITIVVINLLELSFIL